MRHPPTLSAKVCDFNLSELLKQQQRPEEPDGGVFNPTWLVSRAVLCKGVH